MTLHSVAVALSGWAAVTGYVLCGPAAPDERQSQLNRAADLAAIERLWQQDTAANGCTRSRCAHGQLD